MGATISSRCTYHCFPEEHIPGGGGGYYEQAEYTPDEKKEMEKLSLDLKEILEHNNHVYNKCRPWRILPYQQTECVQAKKSRHIGMKNFLWTHRNNITLQNMPNNDVIVEIHGSLDKLKYTPNGDVVVL
jgi:hypothetical protein